MEDRTRGEVLKEGLVVTLGQNMFSLPKRQWFCLRATGLFYSARERVGTSGKVTCSENLIEFETMYLRVEKIEDEKFAYRGTDKITVYCLRIGDKRRCRIMCFPTWEERDFWMISILTAIAEFKILNESREELCGKIRRTARAGSSTLRTRGIKTSSLRLSARFGEGKSLRRRFTSLRNRKSVRESSVVGDFNENSVFASSSRPSSEIYDVPCSVFSYKNISASVSDAEETSANPIRRRFSRRQAETSSSNLLEDCPASPRFKVKRWRSEKTTSTVDFGMKRHLSSFITKFT